MDGTSTTINSAVSDSADKKIETKNNPKVTSVIYNNSNLFSDETVKILANMDVKQQNMHLNTFPPITPGAYQQNYSPVMQNTEQPIQSQQMNYIGNAIPIQSTFGIFPQMPVQQPQIPMQQIQMNQQQIQYPTEPSTSNISPQHPKQITRMTSTSEEEEELDERQGNNTIPWQRVKGTKRKKITKTYANQTQNKVHTSNKFDTLTVEESNTQETNESPAKNINPPPIFIYGVTNYPQMVDQLRNCLEDEQYTTKSLTNNIVKINCITADSYRKMARFLRENSIIHHTYQLKEERAYRVVIKHLHNSIPTKDIKAELTKLGHNVRNIINARNRRTKEPLNLFFVDLEPSNNNKDIYKIERLQNVFIRIEPPHKNKNDIVQCMRCQLYGHSKTYCNRPYACVKCGGPHSTESCKKSRDTPATCALCGGAHPANYKGCDYYHQLIQGKHAKQVSHTKTLTPNKANIVANHYMGPPQNQNILYSDVVNNKPNTNSNINNNVSDQSNNMLSQFLNEFKAMFNQLIQQNSMVLNMLTTLISKLAN